mmetsp:Transcript_33675/g.52659  ORF Transcript_33675/g.52659 Transcript_33675/m.52659 type:complete len:83 (+) Transcript_33675:914-1162(+)
MPPGLNVRTIMEDCSPLSSVIFFLPCRHCGVTMLFFDDVVELTQCQLDGHRGVEETRYRTGDYFEKQQYSSSPNIIPIHYLL